MQHLSLIPFKRLPSIVIHFWIHQSREEEKRNYKGSGTWTKRRLQHVCSIFAKTMKPAHQNAHWADCDKYSRHRRTSSPTKEREDNNSRRLEFQQQTGQHRDASWASWVQVKHIMALCSIVCIRTRKETGWRGKKEFVRSSVEHTCKYKVGDRKKIPGIYSSQTVDKKRFHIVITT